MKLLPTEFARPKMPENITRNDVLLLYLKLLRASKQLKMTNKQFYCRRMRKEFEKWRNEENTARIRTAYEVCTCVPFSYNAHPSNSVRAPVPERCMAVRKLTWWIKISISHEACLSKRF